MIRKITWLLGDAQKRVSRAQHRSLEAEVIEEERIKGKLHRAARKVGRCTQIEEQSFLYRENMTERIRSVVTAQESVKFQWKTFIPFSSPLVS